MKGLNLEQVCEGFSDLYAKLQQDSVNMPVVAVGATALGGIINARRIELRYHAQRRETPRIDFFEKETLES